MTLPEFYEWTYSERREILKLHKEQKKFEKDSMKTK